MLFPVQITIHHCNLIRYYMSTYIVFIMLYLSVVQEHKKSEKAVPCDPQNHKPRNLNLTSNGELPPENKGDV